VARPTPPGPVTQLSIAWLCPANDVLVGAIGTALAVGATVVDQIAGLLSRAAADVRPSPPT